MQVNKTNKTRKLEIIPGKNQMNQKWSKEKTIEQKPRKANICRN